MKVRSKPRPCAQAMQRGGFLVVEALERDGVELDLEARLARGLDAAQDLVEIAPARDGAEFRGVERVERDIDAPDAAIREFGGVARELRAVGRQRQLVERAAGQMPRKRAEQGHDVAPHQRLAAGDAQLARSQPHEGRAQPIELLEGKHVALGQEVHVLGHAIGAAEIAAVGDGDADIAHHAAERIDQRRGDEGRVRVHQNNIARAVERKKGDVRVVGADPSARAPAARSAQDDTLAPTLARS